MTLQETLVDSGIRTALIIDDVYDQVPTSADVRIASRQWTVFFDDMSPEQTALIESRYPESADRLPADLMADDQFVATVWEVRAQLDGLADPVFEEYDRSQEVDQRYVDLVEQGLLAMGLSVETCGRSFSDAAATTDLLVVDLYLGAEQDSAMLAESIGRLAQVIEARVTDPPLVVLMSRSESLSDRRDEFRDKAGLLESGFRILRKPDLEEGDQFETQIERLANSSKETRRLAVFFAALESSVSEANRQTLSLMRKLRLSDIGQIQQLLLDFEGQPTGSYLVDVFDRVFQHELEGQLPIIESAVDLNEFSPSEYPPPYVSGSPDLQELVQRMLSQHVHRLALPGSVGGSLAFGDILRLNLSNCADRERHPAAALDDESVLLVITPACDLQRGEAPRVLLVVGKCEAVTAQNWSCRSDERTSAIRIGADLVWIRWDVKSVLTLSWQQLDDARAEGSLAVVVRLREAHALQLQQRVLSGLGRVGLVSPMPATFAVDLEAYLPDIEGCLHRLEVLALMEQSVCFIGRDQRGNRNLRLIVNEDGCDGLQAALAAVDSADVHQMTRAALKHIQETNDVQRVLSGGLKLNGINDKSWIEVPPITVSERGAVPKMGLVAWNLEVPTERLQNKELAKAGIVLVLRDRIGDDAIGLKDAATMGLIADSTL